MARALKYPRLAELQPGESAFIEGDKYQALRRRVTLYGKRAGKTFAVEKGELGHRVTRVADPVPAAA